MERSRRRENDQHLPICKTGGKVINQGRAYGAGGEVKGGRNRGERPEGGVLGYSRGQEALPTQGSLMRPAGTSQRSAALLACSLHCPLSTEGVCLSVLHHRRTLLPGFLPLGCRHLGQSCAITISSQKVGNHLALSLTTNTGQMKDQEAQRGQGPSWKSHSQ